MKNLISTLTIIRKELHRLRLVWKSALIAPLISTSLYFIIFGAFIGSRVGTIEGVPYMHFLIPGIIMMPAITGAYMHTGFAVFLQRFSKSFEDIQVSPTGTFWILIGFVIPGMCRGFMVSVLVLLASLFFAPLQVFSIGYIFLFMTLTSLVFALVGFAAALHAKTFDDLNVIPTFGLTPLTYLGGVFYSINVLPEFWQTISKLNPILYMVNGFRYGFLGISDVSVNIGIFILLSLITVLVVYNLWLMKKGILRQ